MKNLKIVLNLCISAAISVGLTGCSFVPATQNVPPVPPKPIPLPYQPRVALVLGGGGTRGFAHVGVIEALEKAHIPIDLIVGTSAGSIVGSLYADDPNAEHLQQEMVSASKHKMMTISLAHIFHGVVTGEGLQQFLSQHLSVSDFKDTKIKMVAVATSLTKGIGVPLQSGPIVPAVNASAAVPLIFRPVNIYNQIFVDGGVTDSVAADVAKQFHPKLIIAVDITSPLPKKFSLSDVSVLARSYDITYNKLSKYILKDADIVLRPDVGQVSMLDDSNKYKLIKAGQMVGDKAIPIIKRMMAKRGIKPLTKSLSQLQGPYWKHQTPPQ